MVMRGGKEVITVEIYKEAYEAMKIIANKKHWRTKDHINTVLVEAIERDKFL
jgi:ribosomal protein S7